MSYFDTVILNVVNKVGCINLAQIYQSINSVTFISKQVMDLLL